MKNTKQRKEARKRRKVGEFGDLESDFGEGGKDKTALGCLQ